MKTHMLVEIARVAERTPTDGAFEWLVAGVSPKVNRQSVATRVDFAAIHARVARRYNSPLAPMSG